jgi:hypothetical protein
MKCVNRVGRAGLEPRDQRIRLWRLLSRLARTGYFSVLQRIWALTIPKDIPSGRFPFILGE